MHWDSHVAPTKFALGIHASSRCNFGVNRHASPRRVAIRLTLDAGSTYRDLRKKGIRFESDEALDQPAAKLGYSIVQKGSGVRPMEGSVAVVHYTLREGGNKRGEGRMIYSTLSTVAANDFPTPFVFEVSILLFLFHPFTCHLCQLLAASQAHRASLPCKVGDERVLRGLNQAVLGMMEQEEGVAIIPPALGYTAQVHKACRRLQCCTQNIGFARFS